MEPEEYSLNLIYHFRNPPAALFQDSQGFLLVLDEEADNHYEVDVRLVWNYSLSKADYLRELENSNRLEVKMQREKYILKETAAVRDDAVPLPAQPSAIYQKFQALIGGGGVVDVSIHPERKIIEGDQVVGVQFASVHGSLTRKEEYLQKLELQTNKTCLEITLSTSAAVQRAHEQTQLEEVTQREEAQKELATCEHRMKRSLVRLRSEMAEKDDARLTKLAVLQGKLQVVSAKLKQEAWEQAQSMAVASQILATMLQEELGTTQEENKRALQSHDLALKRTDLQRQNTHNEAVAGILQEEEKAVADLTNENNKLRAERIARLNADLSAICRQHE